MGNVVKFPNRADEITIPESATMIELASLRKIWVRCGQQLNGGYWSPEIVVFTECGNGLLHLYQKGHGTQDHLLFWAMATESGPDSEGLLIKELFDRGGWEYD